MAVRRAAAGADPAVAAVVALGLLARASPGSGASARPTRAARAARAAPASAPGSSSGRAATRAPSHGHVVAERALDALEDAREDPVVGVEVRLALHQAGAAEVIEARAGSSRAAPPRARRGTVCHSCMATGTPRRGARRRGRGTCPTGRPTARPRLEQARPRRSC